jgi:hypothetical protein
VAAIFSPAKITEPKQIDSIIPHVTPIRTSCKIIGSKSALTNIPNGGSFILFKTHKPIPKEKTILTGNGTIREPKNGEDNRKDPTLKVERSKSKR